MFDKLIGFFKSDKKQVEGRSPFDDFWYVGASALSEAGVTVTPANALKVSAIWACNKVISETVAQLPWITYKNLSNGGKERAKDHHLYNILHLAPNRIQTSLEYREQMQTHLNLYGNAYSIIERDYYGNVLSLSLPIHPTYVKVELLDNYTLRYQITEPSRPQKTILQDDMYHLRGTTLNGYTGVSPIEAGKDSIGLAIATEKFGAKFFANSARPSGVLSHPNNLTKEAQDTLRDSIRKQGDSGVLVLEEDMKWEQISTNAENAQFIQTRQHQVEEICRWYRMPPHKIAHLLRSTFSNIEHQSLEFVSDCILPQVKRWEQRAAVTLFDEGYFSEMLVEGLLRGDTSTRIEAYSKMINTSQLSPNEARILENRNPYEGGDAYYKPLNMAEVGAEQVEAPAKQETEAEEQLEEVSSAKKEKAGELQQVIKAKTENNMIENLVRDASERISRAEKREIQKIGNNKQKTEAFYSKHYEYISKTLTPFGVTIEPDKLTAKSGVDEVWLEDHIHSVIMGAINETVSK